MLVVNFIGTMLAQAYYACETIRAYVSSFVEVVAFEAATIKVGVTQVLRDPAGDRCTCASSTSSSIFRLCKKRGLRTASSSTKGSCAEKQSGKRWKQKGNIQKGVPKNPKESRPKISRIAKPKRNSKIIPEAKLQRK